MAIVSLYLSIITLNINGSNPLTERPKSGGLNLKKQKTQLYAVYKRLQFQEHTNSKVKAEKKILHTNGNWKKEEIAVFISDKINFKSKNIKRDKIIVLYW